MSQQDLPVTPTVIAHPAPSWRRHLNATNAFGIVGLTIVLGLVLIAVFAPVLAPYDPTERVGRPFLPPGRASAGHQRHRPGPVQRARPRRPRLAHRRARGRAVALLIGTVVGILAGFYPRRLGAFLMRGVDLLLVLPFLPLLIILAAYLGRSLLTTILVIGLLVWAGSARIIRSQRALAARSRPRPRGAHDGRLRPAPDRPARPAAGAAARPRRVRAGDERGDPARGRAQLPRASAIRSRRAGARCSTGPRSRGAFLTPAWLWWVLPPGLMIMLAALGFALLGFALEQRVNPRLRQAR